MKKLLVMLVAAALLAVATGIAFAVDAEYSYYDSGNIMRKIYSGYPAADVLEYLDENLYGGYGRLTLQYTYDLEEYETWDWMSDYVMYSLYGGAYSIELEDYIRKGVDPYSFMSRYCFKHYGNYTNMSKWVWQTKSEITVEDEDYILKTTDREVSPRKTLVLAYGEGELIANFGSIGVYRYNGGISWTKWSGTSPEELVAAGSDIIGDFGSSGIYTHNSGTLWTKIASTNPDELVVFDEELLADLGSKGLYRYNGATSWTKIASTNPEKIYNLGSQLIVNFGSIGVYNYNGGTSWTKICTTSPVDMLLCGSDLIANFSSLGVYKHNGGTSWTKWSGTSPEELVDVDSELIGDFGSKGIYKHNSGTSWTKIASTNPDELVVFDEELLADLGSKGLYRYNSGTSWTKIASTNPEKIYNLGSQLIVDFGSIGVYKYNGGTSWTKICTTSPDGLYISGSDLIGDFGPLGFLKHNGGTSWTKIASNSPYVNNLTEYKNCYMNVDEESDYYGEFTKLLRDDETLQLKEAVKYHNYGPVEDWGWGDGSVDWYQCQSESSWQLVQENDLPESGIASEGFMRGINLPWLNYGSDIGTPQGFSTNYDKLYAALSDYAGSFVRVFIFADASNGIEFEDGYPIGFTDEGKVYADMQALLDTCLALGIKVMPVLFDGAAGAGGGLAKNHADLITDSDRRDALIALLTKPDEFGVPAPDSFFSRFVNHPAIFAWDIMNEPEGAIDVGDVPIEIGNLQDFVVAFSNVIHAYASGYYQPMVTVGSERRSDLEAYWAGLVGFNDGYLDYYQYHYYDSMGSGDPDGIDDYDATGFVDRYGNFVPTILGELEPTSFTNKLDTLASNNYVGGLFWQDATYSITDSQKEELRYWYPDTDVVTTYTYYDAAPGRMKQKNVTNTDATHYWIDWQTFLDEDFSEWGYGRTDTVRYNDSTRDPNLTDNAVRFKFDYGTHYEGGDPYGATRKRCYYDGDGTKLTRIYTRYDLDGYPNESDTYLDYDSYGGVLTTRVNDNSGANGIEMIFASDNGSNKVYQRQLNGDSFGWLGSMESLATAVDTGYGDALSYIYSYWATTGNARCQYQYGTQLFGSYIVTVFFDENLPWTWTGQTYVESEPTGDLSEWSQKSDILTDRLESNGAGGIRFIPALAGEETTAWERIHPET